MSAWDLLQKRAMFPHDCPCNADMAGVNSQRASINPHVKVAQLDNSNAVNLALREMGVTL